MQANDHDPVARLSYRCIFCVRYRRSVLVGKLRERFEELFRQKAGELSVGIPDLQIFPDHVECILILPPKLSIQAFIRSVKGATSRVLSSEYPEIRSRLPSLWTGSFYASTMDMTDKELEAEFIRIRPRSGRKT